MTHASMNPITEDDIANFLVNTPDFFERHAQLLATVKLASPHGQRAVSLQERQAEMLREKIKGLERRIMDMMRHGTDNEALMAYLQRWVKSLLMTPHARDLPRVVAEGIQQDFAVPQVAIKLWDVAEPFQTEAFALGVTDSAKTFAATLATPYVGPNQAFEAVTWLAEPATAQSVALIALRATRAQDTPLSAVEQPVVGMLVLASTDPMHYFAGMGTDFIERLGDLASAALTALR
jgi:uncharacterized protein YigA (DUF484 family)